MNNITIELCKEDRARLDRLAKALEKLQPVETAEVFIDDNFITKAQAFLKEEQEDQKLAVTLELEPVEAPTEPQEATEANAEEITPQADETATEEPTAKEVPEVTLEQIQQKVVQLAACDGGKKKAQVREIINTYGTKVSDLKDMPEKWNEVWDKLTALEQLKLED
jgi:hypothetical protein